MKKQTLIYNGKSKQIFATESQNFIIMTYKDDETAYFGVKKSVIPNKGMLNNKISALIFEYLGKNGIYTHFVERLDESEQLCRRATTLPLEFIVRNVIAGSLSRRLDIEEGTVPEQPIYEICLKSDVLRDPMINRYHVEGLGIANEDTLNQIRNILQKINELLTNLLKKSHTNNLISYHFCYYILQLVFQMFLKQKKKKHTTSQWYTYKNIILCLYNVN